MKVLKRISTDIKKRQMCVIQGNSGLGKLAIQEGKLNILMTILPLLY